MSTDYFDAIRREHYVTSYWRLNDPNGATVAIDSSSHNSLNGSYLGFQTLGPALIQDDDSAGSEIMSSGVSVSVSDIAQLRLTNALSLEAWIVPFSASQSVLLAGKLNSGGTVPAPYSLSLVSGMIAISVGNGSSSSICYGPVIPVGIPSFVSGTLFRGELSVSVNGQLQNNDPVVGSIGDQAQPFTIGGQFSGLIGEVALYSGALSQLRQMKHFAIGQQIFSDPSHFVSVEPPIYS